MSFAKSSLLMAVTALVAACSSTPINTPAENTAPAPAAPAAAAPAAPAPAAESAVSTVTLPAYLDPKSAVSTQRSVYFDFDDSAVKPDYNYVIETQGKYLSKNPSLAVRIEGNTDERGSSEYNLALGQKRAEAVVHALEVYGVKDSQAEPVSYGKEKPRDAGHDETAWSHNRRADVVYPSK